MTDDEARAFFDAFAASADARREAFRQRVAASGGPAPDDFDGSPEGLVPLWEWFVARHGDGRSRGEDAELPAWYEPDAPEHADKAPPPSAVQDADGIALELAAAFRRSVGELEWAIGKYPKRMRYEAQNRPVLRGRHDGEPFNIDVIGVATTLALRAVLGRDTDPEGLLRAWRAWVEPLEAAR